MRAFPVVVTKDYNRRPRGIKMEKKSKEALQVTKEIVVKFIETGRVSPANIGEIFPSVYSTVLTTITAPHLGGTGKNEKNG